MADVSKFATASASRNEALTSRAHLSDEIGQHSHEPKQIAARLAEDNKPSYVGDAVLGAIDGCVTTLAIVAGAVGAQLSPGTVIVLGLANLFGDGFSMAAGNYQRARSVRSHASLVRRTEETHIKQWPDGEREEIRQIYRQKGFTAPLLEEIVDVITADRERWIDTMMSEEWGIGKTTQQPAKVALVTFFAFVSVGLIPLLPFLWAQVAGIASSWRESMAITALAFIAIGAWRAKVFKEDPLFGGLGTLATGGGAALVAYAIARGLRDLIGV